MSSDVGAVAPSPATARSCIASCNRATTLNSPPHARQSPRDLHEKLDQLQELRHEAIHAGSEQAVAKQHERGKYTARERIEKLLDPGSFQELDTFVRHRTHEFDMQKNRP